MDESMLKEMIKAIEDNGIFDFIAINSWRMSKNDLEKISLEMTYAYISKETPEDLIGYLKERFNYIELDGGENNG